jgi:hypothetical protein
MTVADHALVVGCDSYPNMPGADLAGAVADALAVHDWLVDQARVPRDNVVLLVSPSRHGAPTPAGLSVTGPARKRDFAREVRRLIDRDDVSDGDRLTVYFAGHGCRTDPDNPALADDALVFTDFSEDDPGGDAVGVRDLISRLEQTRFGAVVLLVDACRDFPFRRPFQLGGLGFDPATQGRPPPRLYLLQATLPGQPALGGRSAGSERGRFTTALLDGLAGAGSAKEYDDRAARPYVVRWSTLVAYVERAVTDQQPRSTYQGDLILADFADNSFDDVDLTVSVAPQSRSSAPDLKLSVSYRDPSSLDDPLIVLPGPTPARFRVPPRRHRVTAQSNGTWGRMAVDAYADTSVSVTLREHNVTVPIKDPARGPDQGRVQIITDDPAAAIVVTTPDGTTSLRGVQQISGLLTDGLYSVTVTDAVGTPHRAPFDIQAGYETRLSMDMPTPPGGVGRKGHLRWVGAAAARAFADVTHAAGADWFVCLVPRSFRAAARSSDGPARRLRNSRTADTWDWFSASSAARWLELKVGFHRLELPAAPGLIATVEADPAGLLVMYLDRAHLDDARSLVILDRAQRLLSAGRPDAAGVVLAAERRRTSLDGVLLGSSDTPFRQLARTAVPPEARAFLLPGNPWGVLLDRPRS